MSNQYRTPAKPFLKWAGGKSQLLNHITGNIPYAKTDSFTYIEPFIGSGAVLFWVLNNYPNLEKAVINDINTDLIHVYQTIRTNVQKLIKILEQYDIEYNAVTHKSEERKVFYYNKRAQFNLRTAGKIEQSALFIFLNRTCFNGLYRVNRNNEFNVPQGSYKNPQICNAPNLLKTSELLQKVEIINGDFADTINHTSQNSFFYFDPPYKPLSDTSNFNSYAKEEFNDKEQVRLKEFCDTLTEKGIKWVLSNSDVKANDSNNHFFDDLYSAYKIERILARRSINSKASKRGKLSELLIFNTKD